MDDALESGEEPALVEGAGEPPPEGPPLKGPWGPWETVFLSLVVAGLFVLVQAMAVAVFVVFEIAMKPDMDAAKLFEGLETDGDLLGLSTCLTGVLCTAAIPLLVLLRRGPSVGSYLALGRPRIPVLLWWLGFTVLFMGVVDSLNVLLGRPIVPEFMLDVYQSADFVPILWAALVVGAPLFEEALFRGFLFRGLLGSRLGDFGTIATTSLLWTLIHIQYGLYDMTSIFVIGLLLGLARLRSGSIWVPIAMHALNNLVATIETDWHVRALGVG